MNTPIALFTFLALFLLGCTQQEEPANATPALSQNDMLAELLGQRLSFSALGGSLHYNFVMAANGQLSNYNVRTSTRGERGTWISKEGTICFQLPEENDPIFECFELRETSTLAVFNTNTGYRIQILAGPLLQPQGLRP